MSDTQQIKDKLDIVDLIGEYVQLKPAGVNHKGLCPFHREKSPSFMVSRERQSWHCFGCSKGGDIFSFIQEIEGMEFVEALKLLAGKAGIALTNRDNGAATSQRNRLKDIVRDAAVFYHNILTRLPAAQIAREYLTERGLTGETIMAWQIGYIPDQWDLLTKYLLQKGHGIDELVIAGLTIKKDGGGSYGQSGYYDRFRGRIMFPINDVHGGVVGFTGRVLKETEHSGGKYVNTPQTPLYDKSRVVFGLDRAKQAIKRADRAVLVEGQMDVIACHQAGMAEVVATSGTALTDEQITLLKRYSPNLRMAFDADAAGQAAAKRGIDLALQAGMSIRVIQIPDGAGKDPDECIKKNKDTWFGAVDAARDIMDWYLERAFRGRDLHEPKDRQKIVDDVLPEIERIPFAVEQDFWLRELAGRVGVDVSILREDKKRFRHDKKPATNPSRAPSASPVLTPAPVAVTPTTRVGMMVERLVGLIVRFPVLLDKNGFDRLPTQAIMVSPYAPLYEQWKVLYTTNTLFSSILHDTVREHIGEQGLSILLMKAELDFSDFKEKEAREEYQLLTTRIIDEWKKERRKALQHEIERLERSGDTAALTRVMGEFQSL